MSRIQNPAKCLIALAAALLANAAFGQLDGTENIGDDSTIVYPADYFAEFYPVSANDMINRIPGIGLALRRGGGGNNRGLGSGEGEILINSQRIAGKANVGQDQLSRISADQVDYIEIIRGTSEDIAVRGGGQVVNVVLLDTPSRSSTSVEINTDRADNGTLSPGGKLSHSGQSGDFNYLFHVEAEPRYRFSESAEISYNPDFTPRETRSEVFTRDQTSFQTSTNLGYSFDNSAIQVNALYETNSPPSETHRVINDLENNTTLVQREDNDSDFSNWEVGGDYEYSFANGGVFRALFIVNDRQFEGSRNRFNVIDGESEKNLFIFNFGRDRERIVRSSYTWDLNENQGLEMGVEGAQTIRNNDLRLGLNIEGLETSADHGGLVPIDVTNAKSQVEEIRYEPFAVHNWQINPRMTLESTLVFEDSTIEQSGDVINSRSFQFVRPKVDYRFDITPSLQLRAGVEKEVSQLSFSDFSASSDNSDEDKDTQFGNPEIRQEQSWRYELNVEMRLPNDAGVVNTQFYYRDLEDVIDRVDVSPSPDDLQSARGNIGDGKRYGMNLDVSTRLGYLGLPNALLTTGIGLRDSEVIDPFLGIKRRQRNNGRWSLRTGFRHDVPQYGMSYGFNYSHNSNGGSGRTEIDIEDTERRINDPEMFAFVEKTAFEDITFRFEARNLLDSKFCRIRTRYEGATANGIVEEIEDFCNGNGLQLALKVRTTF